MANFAELEVPDLGSSHDVPAIEIQVQVGDTVEKDQGLITLESLLATMDMPASQGGTIAEIEVKVGDVLEGGAVIAVVAAFGAAPAAEKAVGQAHREGRTGACPATPAPAPAPPSRRDADHGFVNAAGDTSRKADIECRLLVLGYGPEVAPRVRFPWRRSRPRLRPGRTLRDARRRVPQRGLHPVEGATARGRP